MYTTTDTLKKVYISIEEENKKNPLNNFRNDCQVENPLHVSNHLKIIHVSWHCFHCYLFYWSFNNWFYLCLSVLCLLTDHFIMWISGLWESIRNEKLPLTFNTCFLNPEITVVSLHSTSCDIWLLTIFFICLPFIYLLCTLKNFHAITIWARNSYKESCLYVSFRFLFLLLFFLVVRHKQLLANVIFGKEKTASK